MKTLLDPVHPGEILLEEFIRPLGISQYRLAKDTDVSARRINEIVQGQRAISADTALRLARFFGTSEMFWLNLQARYDLDVERRRIGVQLRGVVPFVASTRVRRVPARRAAASKSIRISRSTATRKSGK